MAKREEYEAKTEALLLPILEANGFELWDVEYVKEGEDFVLRASIDKPGGIMIDDCELVSRALSDKLDEADFIPDAYMLEVSSPGLGRTIKKDRDFEKCIGKVVDLKLFKALDKVKEFTGTLEAFDKDTVTIGFEDEKVTVFERGNVAVIKLNISDI